jgi:hypothetical protein
MMFLHESKVRVQNDFISFIVKLKVDIKVWYVLTYFPYNQCKNA